MSKFESNNQNEILIPVFLNNDVAAIIEKIPEVSLEYDNINDLILKSLIKFIGDLNGEIKINAINKAINEKLITKEMGDFLLNGNK